MTQYSEQQYWYGKRRLSPIEGELWTPSPLQSALDETDPYNGYPSLAWCLFPANTVDTAQPHRRFTGMNVLQWGGSVDFVPKFQYRSMYLFP